MPARPAGGMAGKEVTAVADRLLIAAEVAEQLRLPTDHVYALTRRGQIPHLRFGRTYRYRAEAIEAWLREQEQNNAKECA